MRYAGQSDRTVAGAVAAIGHDGASLPLDRRVGPDDGSIDILATKFRTCVTWRKDQMWACYEVVHDGRHTARSLYIPGHLPSTLINACRGGPLADLVRLPGMESEIVIDAKASTSADMTVLVLNPENTRG